jgi:hypothetical protein
MMMMMNIVRPLGVTNFPGGLKIPNLRSGAEHTNRQVKPSLQIPQLQRSGNEAVTEFERTEIRNIPNAIAGMKHMTKPRTKADGTVVSALTQSDNVKSFPKPTKSIECI